MCPTIVTAMCSRIKTNTSNKHLAFPLDLKTLVYKLAIENYALMRIAIE